MSTAATAAFAATNPARDAAYATPLDKLDPSRPELFAADEMWWNFERLRAEAPVHYTAESAYGPFWSVTKYNDIMAVDIDHQTFSSEPGIMMVPPLAPGETPQLEGLAMFIAMDPPKHDVQRKAVSPAVSPTNLQILGPLIRERAAAILDGLPIGEEFDWVDKVSMELTAMTLATLFGMPQEDRRKLTYWSDVVTAEPGHGVVETREQKMGIFRDYHAYFTQLWNERVNAEPTGDLISMLAHDPATRGMSPMEYFGNVMLLTVGGNDTTRNTMTGSVYALSKNPDQFAKLMADPSLLPSMVSETIRWQTPLSHMKRRATRDVEFRGQQIKKDDTVVMWYVSGNRDDEVIERPNDYIIDRPRPRQHISFGFGVHRCVGNRLAELQLQIVWEEIMKRFPEINVVAEPKRVRSNFVKGYESMRVVIPRRY
ncbi:cytochrome P450 [Sphingomonas sp. ABOLG]|uniref:cytochrome P450 n=2 Tax=Sphingomonas TaxID=13687 RepID=UPI000F7F912F|nr:cytochrome P450 [Sphingomonas sp. ABOLG]RSV20346.1 cytochrome P450 [Sphingomonas sp. ABOLG]